MIAWLSFILLATLSFQFVLPLGALGDIPLARVMAALIVVIFLAQVFFRRVWRLPTLLFTGALFSFLGIALFSSLWAMRADLAVPKIAFLFNFLPLVFVWYDLSWKEPRYSIRLIQALLFGATGVASIGLIIFATQFFLGAGEVFHFLVEQILPFFLGRELGALVASYPSLLVNVSGETVLRVTAFFPDPHVAAYFFGMSGLLALGMARQSGLRRYFGMATVLFLADILTFSRGGYIGLLSGWLIFLFLSWKDFSVSMKKGVGGALFLSFLAVSLLGQPVLSRFGSSFTLADASSTERIVLWQEALGYILDRPLLGTGLGNYIVVARPMLDTHAPFYAHNLYLDIALEIGILGLMLFLAIYLYALRQAFCARHSDPLAPALVALFVLYLTHSLFETALYSVHVTLVLMLAFVLAASLKQPGDRQA
ncbi:MAG: O-antigen ligase family protein [Candidatus Moraniibacteriota bacterium]|nr:MAG: O-antigen ligase family protein [Candidatus Moranbacteria bacterium]